MSELPGGPMHPKSLAVGLTRAPYPAPAGHSWSVSRDTDQERATGRCQCGWATSGPYPAVMQAATAHAPN